MLAAVVTALFPPVGGMELAEYELGTVVEEDLIAEVPFSVEKSGDELDRERGGAAAAVPPTYQLSADASDRMLERLDDFFRMVDEALGGDDPDEEVAGALSDVGLLVTPEQRGLLLDDEGLEMLRQAAYGAVEEVLPEGVMDDGAPADPQLTSRIQVRGDEEGGYLSRESVLSPREFYDRAGELLPQDASTDLHDLLRLVLIRHFEPSLRYDREATEADRDAARASVSTTQTTVLPGEAILRANQQVGEAELDLLLAYESELRAQGLLEERVGEPVALAGGFLLNLLILGIFGLLLFFFRPEVYRDFRWVLLLALLILAYSGAGGIIARHDFPSELLPVAFATLAVAVLWDGRLALFLALVLATLTGAQFPFQGVGAWVPVAVGGAAAALSVRVVRRRAQTWIFIAIIAAAYAAAVPALGLIEQREPGAILLSVGWATVNTVVSAILAMGFLPVFEWFTRVTTDQTLLEWADPNRSLLKRLALEAPGTYAHTINVANLGEAAAKAIGANELLCRVGVYYHDVGKVLKPQYFIENQPAGRNPHDKLKPATSAAIVREHVTEGVRLAREEGLPEVLVAFIAEHHGTQEIAYFRNRAREEGRGPEDDEVYRYPGPRPRSRETAVAMLADSVESATRSMQEPTPERIRNLIEELTDGKVRDGQLDHAPITLREITIIKEQFEKVLAGMYHHRIDYPATKHLTDPAVSKEEGPKEDEGDASEIPGDAVESGESAGLEVEEAGSAAPQGEEGAEGEEGTRGFPGSGTGEGAPPEGAVPPKGSSGDSD